VRSTYKSVLRKVSSARGIKAKQRALKEADEFTRDLIRWSCDKTMPFYVRKFYVKGSGAETLSNYRVNLKILLEASNSREITGKSQLSVLKAFGHDLHPEEAKIFCGVLNKNLTLGLGAVSINQVFPGLIPVFAFMRAKPYESKRLVPNSFMSLKLDGLRGMFRDGSLYSSGGRKFKGLDHITSQLDSHYELEGELLIPGLSFYESSGKIRSTGVTPEAEFHVFDCANLGNMAFTGRYFDILATEAQFWPSSVQLLKHVTVLNDEHVQRNFAKALDAGYEGLVVKAPNAPYEAKRTFSWMKLKAVDPEEVTIIGFLEGEGKFSGTLGSVVAKRSNGVEVQVGGFSDHIRNHIWENRDLWLDEIMEIMFHEETPEGSLRHPRYNHSRDVKLHRHRWDKSGNPLEVW